MAENTKIEWTDHTFNPWWGCTKVAPGCANCYAEAWAKRFGVALGPHGIRRKTSDTVWRAPLKWNAAAAKAGARAKVFCASMADVFEPWDGDVLDSKKRRLWIARDGAGEFVPETAGYDLSGCRPARLHDLWIRLFDLIDRTPYLDWLLLTKRPERIWRMWPDRKCPRCYGTGTIHNEERGIDGDCPSCEGRCTENFRANVWLGTSISTQEDADRNIPELLKCRDLVPVLFVSAEPLLGPVDLCRCGKRIALPEGHGILCPLGVRGVDWLIVGGESGQGLTRPMHPAWARALRDQCQAAGVPFFFKQWGECCPTTTFYNNLDPEMVLPMSDGIYPVPDDVPTIETIPGHGKIIHGVPYVRCGKKAAGRLLDGREWSEFPPIQETHT